jgi:hypothetical protein
MGTDQVDADGNPVRSVTILGVSALALQDARRGHTIDKPLVKAIINGEEIVTVKDAEDAYKQRGSTQDVHVCPLCEDGFLGYEALRIHAPDCVQARAPRKHIWIPAGFSDAAIVNYDKPVRMTD